MQKKKVLLLTYGNRDHGSSRIRGINHFERLKGQFDTDWRPRTGLYQRKTGFQKIRFAFTKMICQLQQILAIIFKKYDIVFIQIMFLPEWALKILKNKGTVIVYDFDDAVYTYSQSKFDMLIRYSDKIVVASPFLYEKIRQFQKDCAVILSPVDTDIIQPKKIPHSTFTIGWIGSPWTIQYLKELESILKNRGFKLLVVGGEFLVEGTDVECLPWSEQNELQALDRMDIGIMPLRNDEWSTMKGGYKLYLYMAAGKPVVASPHGINNNIVMDGVNGYLAETTEQWLVAFEKLASNNELRSKMGAAARKNAEELYSYKVCTPQLFNFIDKK